MLGVGLARVNVCIGSMIQQEGMYSAHVCVHIFGAGTVGCSVREEEE